MKARSNTSRVSRKIKTVSKLNKDCKHRGQETRKVTCPTCSGNKRMKVFACSVHGECTLSSRISGKNLQLCSLCSKYEV